MFPDHPGNSYRTKKQAIQPARGHQKARTIESSREADISPPHTDGILRGVGQRRSLLGDPVADLCQRNPNAQMVRIIQFVEDGRFVTEDADVALTAPVGGYNDTDAECRSGIAMFAPKGGLIRHE